MDLRNAAFSIGAAMLLAGAPAAAVESLTGTYEGKIKCQTLTAGTPSSSKQLVTVEIIDDGVEGLSIEIGDFSVSGRWFGYAVALAPKPESGVVSAASCGFNFADLEGGTLQGAVKTKVGSDKASIKWVVMVMDESTALARACLLTAKRVSTVEPTIPLCVVKALAP